MNLTEQEVSKEVIFKGKILNLEKYNVKLPNGNLSTREVVDHPGAVAILPIDSEGNIYVSHEYPYNGPGSVSGSHWVGVASYNNDTTSPSYGYAFSASLIKSGVYLGYSSPLVLRERAPDFKFVIE